MFVLGFFGCDTEDLGKDKPSPEEPGADTTVSLDHQTLDLAVGETKPLTLTVNPANAGKAVTWESSAPGIAEVDANGKVTGKAAGKATVTVTAVNGGNTDTCTVTVKHVYGVPVTGAEIITSIKAKFGVTEKGAAGVTEAFKELSAFIHGGGLTDKPGVIQLGHWIDLDGGLTVAEDNSNADPLKAGKFNSAAPGMNWNETVLVGPQGPRKRLIVVGINSFNNKNGNGTTPHVVFQFNHLSATHNMDADKENATGYADSDMRKYLTELKDSGGNVVPGTGNFLAGLTAPASGVPREVLWPPKRLMGKKDNPSNTTVEIEDLLWLPTLWEMFGGNDDQNTLDVETDQNQARLEYYATDPSRIKLSKDSGGYPSANAGRQYWLASMYDDGGNDFCTSTSSGASNHTDASAEGLYAGVSPAFCVYGGLAPAPAADE